jgi:hypothetical protein
VDDACARVLVLLGMAEYTGIKRAGGGKKKNNAGNG